MTSVLVTGANGFVGKVLCETLLASKCIVKAAVRSRQAAKGLAVDDVAIVGSVDASTDWQAALKSIDVVVHLVARVHIMQDNHADPLAEFREINVEGTANLARQAVAQGVKRFIYLSSIKVNGEKTQERAFSAEDESKPQDPYGVSKWEAELALNEISAATGLEVVVIRPPLIYGPGVKGNVLRLIKLLQKGYPTPFGRVNNKRSMVNLDNLCDLIRTCITHQKANGQVFLVSDQRDISTAELIRFMAQACNKTAWLLPVPVKLLRFCAVIVGKGAEIDRLCGSLQIDMVKTQQLLQWQPPFSVQEGIKKTIDSYVA